MLRSIVIAAAVAAFGLAGLPTGASAKEGFRGPTDMSSQQGFRGGFRGASPGGFRGGFARGPGFAGPGFRGGFARGPAFRGGFARGPAFRGGFARGPAFRGGFARAPGFRYANPGFRRYGHFRRYGGFRRYGYVGLPLALYGAYSYYNYDDCLVRRAVPTPWGWQVRWVNVCGYSYY